jgi:hypothetical protein
LEKFGQGNDKQPHQLHALKNNLISKQLTQLVMALCPLWQVQTSVGRFFEFLKKLWFQFFNKIFQNQRTISSLKFFRKEPPVPVVSKA